MLDEPTAMLDPMGRRGGAATPSSELNRERGITVVLITHHMDEAAQADRAMVVMNQGQVSPMDGTPKEVFAQVEELRAVGLTVRRTRWSCCTSCGRRGMDVPLDALTRARSARDARSADAGLIPVRTDIKGIEDDLKPLLEVKASDPHLQRGHALRAQSP